MLVAGLVGFLCLLFIILNMLARRGLWMFVIRTELVRDMFIINQRPRVIVHYNCVLQIYSTSYNKLEKWKRIETGDGGRDV
jgi:hypothetical protein